MSITTQVAVSVVSNLQRTWRINIETLYGQDYLITAYRENLGLDANTVVQSTVPAPTVLRAMSGLIAGNEPAFACADGTQITIAHLYEAISGLCDRWASQGNPLTLPAPAPVTPTIQAP